MPYQELWKLRKNNCLPDDRLISKSISESNAYDVGNFLAIIADIKPQKVVENIVEVLADSIVANKQYGNYFAVLCSSEQSAKLLYMGTPDPNEELRMHELGSIAVPNLYGLSTNNMVSIRANSGYLDVWRNDLSKAPDVSKRLREKKGERFDTSKVVSEIMNDARESLLSETKKTKVLSKKTLTNYAVGLLGSLAPDSISGLIGGIATATAATILQALFDRKQLPQYLQRHYLVFRDNKD